MLDYAAQLAASAGINGDQDGSVKVNTIVATHEELNAKLRTPLAAAFAAFDLDGDGLLSREEAAAFFMRYVQVVRKLTFSVGLPRKFSAMVPQIIAGAVANVPWGDLPAEALEQTQITVCGSIMGQMDPQLSGVWTQHVALFDAATSMAEHSVDLDGSNTRAFDVVDIHQKGKIGLDEMFAALIPGAPQQEALTLALGLRA